MNQLIYDVTCLMPEKISGVGVYTKNLYLGLKKLGVNIEPVIKWSRAFKKNHVTNHIAEKEKIFPPISFSSTSGKVFHGPDFRLMSGTGRLKRVVTVHDLAVFHPGFNAEPFRVRGQKLVEELMAQKPDCIIVDADYVAQEIAERFPQIADRVKRVYLGVDHLAIKNITPPEDAFVYKDGGYFLYVGHIETRKNVQNIIKAFEILAAKNREVRLFVVGKNGHQGDEILEQIVTSDYSDRIVLPGFLGTADLQKLYSGALAFLFPSHYEGFGLPSLEAMLLGCPVITSNHGTMREVAGDAALFCDAKSAESISSLMEKITMDPALRRTLIAKGQDHAAAFTWENTAKQMLNIYNSL